MSVGKNFTQECIKFSAVKMEGKSTELGKSRALHKKYKILDLRKFLTFARNF